MFHLQQTPNVSSKHKFAKLESQQLWYIQARLLPLLWLMRMTTPSVTSWQLTRRPGPRVESWHSHSLQLWSNNPTECRVEGRVSEWVIMSLLRQVLLSWRPAATSPWPLMLSEFVVAERRSNFVSTCVAVQRGKKRKKGKALLIKCQSAQSARTGMNKWWSAFLTSQQKSDTFSAPGLDKWRNPSTYVNRWLFLCT